MRMICVRCGCRSEELYVVLVRIPGPNYYRAGCCVRCKGFFLSPSQMHDTSTTARQLPKEDVGRLV
ncbi:hypothetical protein [Dictyobacter formicarum]|uniref:hypothetical protein n=1 Tax=Dictyobacter formicarum TaxID=2778368 RepID=UPI001915AAC1|nr:hypothetical protein [Dictyobacter formicarum]